jgi:Lon protease-like protein
MSVLPARTLEARYRYEVLPSLWALALVGREPTLRQVKLPREVPVMTLPQSALLPQAMLPLFIFEPRYRQMLTDVLNSHRMFSVAMQRPDTARETPLPVAGLGLVRVSVGHKDGTSHLILQGLARVELEETVRVKPYRIARVRAIPTPPCDTVTVDALLRRVRELLKEWLSSGTPETPFGGKASSSSKPVPPDEVLSYLSGITCPEQATDLISCAVLKDAADRQVILEAADMETRLRRLAQFLLEEIRRKREDGRD